MIQNKNQGVFAVIFGIKQRSGFGLYVYTIPKPFRRFLSKNPSQKPKWF
jgi:hypothetical protein